MVVFSDTEARESAMQCGAQGVCSLPRFTRVLCDDEAACVRVCNDAGDVLRTPLQHENPLGLRRVMSRGHVRIGLSSELEGEETVSPLHRML